MRRHAAIVAAAVLCSFVCAWAESDEAYKMLVLHVNAHALLEGEAAYAAFIDYANTEIEHFRKEVLGGKKKSATSADGGTASADVGGDAE